MKEIFGLKVSINGQEICRAGFEKENSVVKCIVSSIRRKDDETEVLDLSVGGLNSDTRQHADWAKSELSAGDKVSIEVISDDFDLPKSIREPVSEKSLIDQKLQYFYRLKEELKDHINESTNANKK